MCVVFNILCMAFRASLHELNTSETICVCFVNTLLVRRLPCITDMANWFHILLSKPVVSMFKNTRYMYVWTMKPIFYERLLKARNILIEHVFTFWIILTDLSSTETKLWRLISYPRLLVRDWSWKQSLEILFEATTSWRTQIYQA